jgi:hypothetical protein
VSGPKIKYVNIKYHFVQDYIEDGVIEIIFVKSEEMTVIFSQNIWMRSYSTKSKKYSQALDDDGKGVGNAG